MLPPLASEREDRWEFVRRWLIRRRAHLAAAVLRLGQPHMTEVVATAAIVAHDRVVRLYFNPRFLQDLDNAELAGVLCHEALHLCFKHPQRVEALRNPLDRRLFEFASEAVINDLILQHFKEMKLPGHPITGPWLVGRDTSQMSADQVFQLLWPERSSSAAGLDRRLAAGEATDDHSLWESDLADLAEFGNAGAPSSAAAVPSGDSVRQELPTHGLWTAATSLLVEQLLEQAKDADPCCGSVAIGAERFVPKPRPCRKSMARFLEETVAALAGYDTDWTTPNRKLLGIYPQVMLPSYPGTSLWNIVVAIDSSGSVPTEFLAVATAFAQQRILKTRITLVSFDTRAYPAAIGGFALKGGGGTRAQAVEEFILANLRSYPDIVFLLTDGWTPAPTPRHPDRWIWLLPPWGSVEAAPKGSHAEFFEAPPSTTRNQRSWRSTPRSKALVSSTKYPP